MNVSFKIPFYAKVALLFFGLLAFIFILYIGQATILPVVFAALIAILLNPAVNFLIHHKIGKVVSIIVVIVISIVAIAGVLYIISWQLTMFKEKLPLLEEKFGIMKTNVVNWLSLKFNVSGSRINSWIDKSEHDALHSFSVGEKLTEAIQLMVEVILLPVYVFLFIYYKPLLLDFILKLFRTQHHAAVADVLINTKQIIQTYLVGLFIEGVIVATLNSAGLLMLGIDYAIILGIIGTILNVIPYIGGIIAIALPMIIAFVTKDSFASPILVFVVYVLIQFIDNHYLIPRIVASRVKLNALIAIIVVLIGNAIWGVPGMFLSIPLTAIVKVIFDHIQPLKPWGFLLGNVIPSASRFSHVRKKNKTIL